MRVCSVEVGLCNAIRELEFGELSPHELVPGKPSSELTVNTQEAKLLHAFRQYGTPLLIKIADGRPLYAEFEIKTRIGPARKRINFS